MRYYVDNNVRISFDFLMQYFCFVFAKKYKVYFGKCLLFIFYCLSIIVFHRKIFNQHAIYINIFYLVLLSKKVKKCPFIKYITIKKWASFILIAVHRNLPWSNGKQLNWSFLDEVVVEVAFFTKKVKKCPLIKYITIKNYLL